MAKPSDELIRLARASAEARRKALSGTYTKETWEAWRKAAEEFMAAVTAEASGQDRHELEMAAKEAAQQQPEADPGEEP
ncbi:hypothetical protein [Streptomyces sp. NPDC001750]|uniref:hypothetical protein n=1 Tax=Streptomyces sp. NPDC001750 TaxID=3364607 RepID=UPI0036B23FD4